MRDTLRATRMSVGRNVRRLRLLRGFSQERLAELAGTGDKHIGQIERGEVNTGIDTLSAVAAALSVNVAALFGEPRRTGHARVFVLTESELDRLHEALRVVRAIRRTGQPSRRK